MQYLPHRGGKKRQALPGGSSGGTFFPVPQRQLGGLLMEKLRRIPHLRLLGGETAEEHHGIFTFTIEGVHPHDAAEILGADGICVRAGHHCAQPLFQRLGTGSAVRASLMFYNTEEEIDRLEESLRSLRRRMGYGE